MDNVLTIDKRELCSALKSRKTSFRDKKEIINLIGYSNGYKNDLIRKKTIKITSLSYAKELFLFKMKQDYNYYGLNLINFVLELNHLNILKSNIEEPAFKNSMNKISNIMLELYSDLSNELYKIANKIIDDKSILIVNNINCSSYMTYLSTIKKAYCVIDKYDSPYVMIHEIEHAIEAYKNIISHRLYNELGSITFETLFTDKLVKNGIENANLLYFSRLNDDQEFLKNLSKYFHALLHASKTNFNMTNFQFVEMLSYFMRISKKDIISFISDEITNDYLTDQLTYLISHITSFEIRDMIYNDKDKGINYLLNYLTKYNINLEYNEKNIDSIKKYVKEINIKK